MSSQSLTVIKGLSIMLISAALGITLWNLVAPAQLPSALHSTLRFAYGALVAHAIEGLVAAVYAPSRQEPPIRYGFYTFFTGFPSLVELFSRQERPQ
ncbi:hypothetical protein [Acaryochloris thomasi]|nr:hypothetical protein [Acaryochloris thomasi]